MILTDSKTGLNLVHFCTAFVVHFYTTLDTCYDNAACDSFFHTLKVEHVYRIAFESMEHARREIFWFIEAYYNFKRKHSKLGYQSPVKFESAALKIAA